MQTLLDTNILLRSVQPSSPDCPAAIAAVAARISAGSVLCVSSQMAYEFLAVATRSVANNGLGMSQADADAQLDLLLSGLDIIYDSQAVLSERRRLVIAHGVSGKKVHDTRLVAIMNVHGISELLSFNHADFRRFSINVVAP